MGFWPFGKSREDADETKISSMVSEEKKHIGDLGIIIQLLQKLQKSISVWMIDTDHKFYIGKMKDIKRDFEALEDIWEKHERSSDKKIQLMRNQLDEMWLAKEHLEKAKSADIAAYKNILRKNMRDFGEQVNKLLDVCGHISIADKKALDSLVAADKALKYSVNFLQGN